VVAGAVPGQYDESMRRTLLAIAVCMTACGTNAYAIVVSAQAGAEFDGSLMEALESAAKDEGFSFFNDRLHRDGEIVSTLLKQTTAFRSDDLLVDIVWRGGRPEGTKVVILFEDSTHDRDPARIAQLRRVVVRMQEILVAALGAKNVRVDRDGPTSYFVM
jgi:hypothetical protein